MDYRAQVVHARFGQGVIVDQRWKGLEVLVRFDSGIKIWIRREELTFQDIQPPTEVLPPIEVPPAVPDRREQLKARTMIEAFRLGIVPAPYVEEFIFGRESELETIKTWLCDPGSPGTFVIKGPYGSGKTHLIDFLTSAALKLNYAVAKVQFDLFESPPHQPKRIYQRLVRSFRYPTQGGERDFRHFLREIGTRAPHVLEKHHIFNNFFYELSNFETEELWEWIEGQRTTYLSGLYDTSTAANIYCYLLSGLGAAAVQGLNHRGLLLLCDEAETVNFGLEARHRDRGIHFLIGLIYLSQNDHRLQSEEIRLEYVTPTQRLNLGAETRLVYHGVNRCRYLYQNPSGVKVLFAFTPIDMIDKLAAKLGVQVLELESWSEAAYRQLFDETYRLYTKAYPGFLLTPQNLGQTFDLVLVKTQETLRLFIKGSVEAFDLIRHYPGKPMRELLG